jgi:hypothetical protein
MECTNRLDDAGDDGYKFDTDKEQATRWWIHYYYRDITQRGVRYKNEKLSLHKGRGELQFHGGIINRGMQGRWYNMSHVRFCKKCCETIEQ